MRSFSLPWFARTGCVCWVGVKINVVLSGTTVISNTAYFSPRASSACSHKSAETHISTPRETDRFLLTDFLLQQGENVLQWSTLSACTALSCRAGSSRAFPHCPAPLLNALGMQQIAANSSCCSFHQNRTRQGRRCGMLAGQRRAAQAKRGSRTAVQHRFLARAGTASCPAFFLFVFF